MTTYQLANIREGYAEVHVDGRQIGAVERMTDHDGHTAWAVQPEGWWKWHRPELNPDNNFGMFFDTSSHSTRREAAEAAVALACDTGLL